MTTIYLETSAILAWLLEQPHYEKVILHLENAEHITISILTLLETKRAMGRLKALKEPNYSQQLKMSGALERDSSYWDVMEISHVIQQRISEPFPVEPVRTLDAIHLATALEFKKSFPDLQVLTFDDRIISNLEPLGLELAKI